MYGGGGGGGGRLQNESKDELDIKCDDGTARELLCNQFWKISLGNRICM